MADVGRDEVVLRRARDEAGLRTIGGGAPDRDAAVAVVVVRAHDEHALADEPRGLAVRQALGHLGQREAVRADAVVGDHVAGTAGPRERTGADCTSDVVVWPNGVKRSISSSRWSTSRTFARRTKQSSPVTRSQTTPSSAARAASATLAICRGAGRTR